MLDLDMGAYGFFVWGSYGVSAVALLAMVAVIWRNARKTRRALDRMEAER